jgi:hypothetical protein
MGLVAGLVMAAIAFIPSPGFAGNQPPVPRGSSGCASGSIQVLFQNRSYWLLVLSDTSDPAVTPPQLIPPLESELWCLSSSDANGSISYSLSQNSGSIITYSVSGGSVSSVSVLPEGGPPTLYCTLHTNAGRSAVVIFYLDERPDASAAMGTCTLPNS